MRLSKEVKTTRGKDKTTVSVPLFTISLPKNTSDDAIEIIVADICFTLAEFSK